MFETMDKAPGVGLAATQVGEGLRVFTYTWTEDDDTLVRGVVINPSLELGPISTDEPDEETESEGCLSFPTYRFPIKRAEHVVLTGIDLEQNPVRIEANGWLARIFQHEYDHLHGVLFIDKLGPIGKIAAKGAIAAFERMHQQAQKKGEIPPDAELIARLENRDTQAMRDLAAANVEVAKATLGQGRAELLEAELVFYFAR